MLVTLETQLVRLYLTFIQDFAYSGSQVIHDIVYLHLTVTTSFTSAAFGVGTGPIWMSGLTCVGTETSLFSCNSNTPLGSVELTTTCAHTNDVAVRCQGLPTGDLLECLHHILNYQYCNSLCDSLHLC